ncbi:bifunctional diguanylate cyclase/phosphodiesterase [Herbaspirillum sp. SJZ107]|uniref:putative bifunctional diguanylate cyclase/phosphodiesterase n=1 Tax=Herbaspirillum sp. SJZ107 TaxID=2572881 RepID=UPI001153A497|nr:EAL domain-containing protein [Herbaspirillum sp. SJZ107]TQK10708.1 PAS domain S-box-containing protein/diguanylate cyclase (GGDEF)-like protein [Herbaspirillum sp. SJZ107]
MSELHLTEPAPLDLAASSAAVCDAVLKLRGAPLHAALGRIAAALLASPEGSFDAGADPVSAPEEGTLEQDVVAGAEHFGRYRVAGRSYGADDRRQLDSLAGLTATLLQVHALAQRTTHAYAQVEAQLAHQSQILDQIHESVLTTDLMGYITSWNRGAEQLFGYSALEAVGRHILFLYADEDPHHPPEDIPDAFAAQGGRMMEVRRQKKSGEVFWASLSLSPLRDLEDHPIGLIAYLTDITERKQAEERLHHLAYYQELTGLPNRTLFGRLVEQALTVTQRNDAIACVLYIDLNRFKLINGTLGRRVGDELLRRVAERFRGVLRDEDVVAHLSGDEFAVGLFDIRQHFEATTVARKLQACLAAPLKVGEHELRVGASVGIAVYPQDGQDAETLLRMADIAMQRAKEKADNPDRSVAFYRMDMNEGMQQRMQIESGLRHALGHGELVLHYQPKFEIGSSRLVGAEALVRWRHPQRGMVPPGDFIPLAESTGLIVQLGEWVLERACAQAAVWQGAGLPPFRLAVNVSAREFTASLPGRVADTLARYRLDPSWLELEITESTLMHDIDDVIAIMDRINALGVALSLDDFGTGYSSLSYLKRFPINTLKIDRSFTNGLPADTSDCAIASTIISMGRRLGHRVIAEGVETLEQLAFLSEAGCDEVQGYLYAKPLPAYEFETGLRENWLLTTG